jgi:hypothetical protein
MEILCEYCTGHGDIVWILWNAVHIRLHLPRANEPGSYFWDTAIRIDKLNQSYKLLLLSYVLPILYMLQTLAFPESWLQNSMYTQKLMPLSPINHQSFCPRGCWARCCVPILQIPQLVGARDLIPSLRLSKTWSQLVGAHELIPNLRLSKTWSLFETE